MNLSTRNYPLLFEILRSFSTLASTLNLSHAVRELGSTRQTVRRHIAQLEEIKGGELFVVTERQYELTDLGHKVLPEALDLLARAEAWVRGATKMIGGMQYLYQATDSGWFFYQQQHPIGKLRESTGTMLQDTLKAWAYSGGDVEHDEMLAVRPKCQIFRRSEGRWLFTEVGDESSFVTWYGRSRALSTIGRTMGEMPGGAKFGLLVGEAYREVEANESIRLDHVYSVFKAPDSDDLVPVCFERLLLGSRFADGSFAMLSAVRRTYDVEIEGVTDEMLRLMPEDKLM